MPDATDRWGLLDRDLAALHALPEREPLQASGLVHRLRDLDGHGELAALPGDPQAHEVRVARVRTVTRRLVRQNRYRPALEILSLVLRAWDPDPVAGLQAIAAHAGTSLTGVAPDDLVPLAGAALQGADRAWEAGDVGLAAELVVIGAGLLLHRDLHADAEHSPLADDPSDFLAPVRRSVVMTALRAPVEVDRGVVGAVGGADRVDGAGGAGGAGGRPSAQTVVVLRGTYPRFAGPVIDVLRQKPGLRVEVVDLPEQSRALRWLGTDPELVRLRLLATRGELPGCGPDRADAPTPRDGFDADAFGVPREISEVLARADVVVADWGDRGALWASLMTPPSTRLVVRLHGMDTLSLWVHTLDWSRVDALITVSPHHAALTEEILRHGAAPAGERLPRCQAVPHAVRLGAPVLIGEDSPEVTPREPGPAAPVREPHTLGMIGWGKPVKDPLWAVELLAELRRRGGNWRLRLVGDGFRPGGVVTAQEYAVRFEERIRRPDVAGAVERLPQTDDVPAEVARLGFVLSASRRESFHLGLVEGVLGGAVPVVRDWPFYARQGGPGRLFPPDWVVRDVEAAVERIWSLREEPVRAPAAEHARREAQDRFDPDRVDRQLLAAVLGRTSP